MPFGMEDRERQIWWKTVTKCWMQDPLQQPSMEEVSKKLLDLRKIMTQRIQGIFCPLKTK